MEVKMICVSVNQISGATAEAPAILRVYQSSREEEAAAVSLSQPGTFNQEVSVEVHQDNGTRQIIVDLWDPSGQANNVSIYGDIAIFGVGITGDDDGGSGFVPGVYDDNFGVVV
jgi:hypothetical protein